MRILEYRRTFFRNNKDAFVFCFHTISREGGCAPVSARRFSALVSVAAQMAAQLSRRAAACILRCVWPCKGSCRSDSGTRPIHARAQLSAFGTALGWRQPGAVKPTLPAAPFSQGRCSERARRNFPILTSRRRAKTFHFPRNRNLKRNLAKGSKSLWYSRRASRSDEFSPTSAHESFQFDDMLEKKVHLARQSDRECILLPGKSLHI